MFICTFEDCSANFNKKWKLIEHEAKHTGDISMNGSMNLESKDEGCNRSKTDFSGKGMAVDQTINTHPAKETTTPGPIMLQEPLNPVGPRHEDAAAATCTTQIAPLQEYSHIGLGSESTNPSSTDHTMDVAMSSVSSSSQPDKDCTTAIMLPESPDPPGPSADGAACPAQLAPLQENVQFTPDPMQAIGPYMTSAGIDKTNFSSDLKELPTVTELKNGHVLELHQYFTKTLGKTQIDFAKNLVVIGGHAEANLRHVVAYVSMVVKKHKDAKRNLKGAKLLSGLEQLLDAEFCFVRSRKLKEPDTPRKKGLREELSSMKMKNKRLKRKLGVMEADLSALKVTAHQCEALKEQLHEAKQGKLIAETLALMDAMDRQGGFWSSTARIEREFLKLQDKDEKTIKHAIYDQLQFLHKVLLVKKDILQLSKTSNGIRIDFTKEEMKAHLIEVVQQFLQPPSPVDDPLDYSDTDSEEVYEQKHLIKKRRLGEKLMARKENKAIRCTQEHLESLTQNPHLLIGKTISLASAGWMAGVVIGITREDENPLLTEFSIDFKPLNSDDKESWICVLRPIEDLKNNDLIIRNS